MGRWCITVERATTCESRIFGEQGNSWCLAAWGKYSYPLLFAKFFSSFFGVFLCGFVFFFNIICNLGKQNWASMDKIIILAGGDGWGSDSLAAWHVCCAVRLREVAWKKTPFNWSEDLLEERKLSGRPHTQLPFLLFRVFGGGKKKIISSEAFSTSLVQISFFSYCIETVPQNKSHNPKARNTTSSLPSPSSDVL